MADTFFTVDLEPDCPPYLSGWRGVEEGMPLLMTLLEERGIRGTFFATGETATRFPGLIDEVLDRGHELGCHGQTHRPFPGMAPEEASWEIRTATAILREHGPVTAFRAPYLRFPEDLLPLLEEEGYRVDASRTRYKPIHWGPSNRSGLARLKASTTSSVLRLSPWLRDPLLARLASPVVLFIHPWELVDLTRAPIPWDSRLGTGPHALASLESALDLLQSRGATFRLASEAAPNRPPVR